MPDTKTRLLAAVKNGDDSVMFGKVRVAVVPTGDFYRVEVSGDQPEGFKWDEFAGLSYWEGALIDDAVTKIDAALKGLPVKGEVVKKIVIEAEGMSLTELVGITKPYDKVSDAPANVQELDGAKLTLAQVNWIANVADGLEGREDIDSPWAVAINQFKQSFKKEDGKWVEKKKPEKKAKARGEGQGVGGPKQGDGGADTCACTVCGHTIPHEKGTPCADVACPECGAAMVGKEMPRDGAVIIRDDADEVVAEHTFGLNGEYRTVDEAIAAARSHVEKEVSLDASLQQVRDAFYVEFRPPGDTTPVDMASDFYVKEIYPTFVIAEGKGKLYKVAYMGTSGAVTFVGQDKWQQVKIAYMPVGEEGQVTLEKEPTIEKEPMVKMAVAVAKAMLKRQKSVAHVWKEGDDRYYMALISMAIFDEENQIVEKEGMDCSIELSQKHGYKSGLYIRHVVPKSLVGRCMYERRIGPYWVEVGKFLDTSLAERAFTTLEKDEEGKWRLSIGFITTKDQAKSGRYTRLLKYDTTITDRPALPVTAILAIGGKTEMDDMAKLLTFLNPQSEEEKEKDLAMLGDLFELGEKELTAIVKEVEQMQALRKALDEAGIEDEAIRAKILEAVDEAPAADDEPPVADAPPAVDLSQQIQDAVTAAMTEVGDRLTALEERPGAADAVKEISDLLKKRSKDLPKPTETAPIVEGVSELVDVIDKHIGDKPGPKHPFSDFAGGPGPEEGGK